MAGPFIGHFEKKRCEKFQKKFQKKNFKKNFRKKNFVYKNLKNNNFLLKKFFENFFFWNFFWNFSFFFSLNHQRTSQDWYRFNKILFLSLGEQKYKNCYLGQGTFENTFHKGKFAFWVNLHPTLWVLGVSGASIVPSGS